MPNPSRPGLHKVDRWRAWKNHVLIGPSVGDAQVLDRPPEKRAAAETLFVMG
jgi:hypothetical protein